MILLQHIKKYFPPAPLLLTRDTNAREAYDLWCDDYDLQPDNLMMALDEEILTGFLKKIIITNKKIADVGCGTGRHWQRILSQQPASLSGFDISDGMLKKLKEKFPAAHT